MGTRLAHSERGCLRYMQMSSTRLFVFVEGTETDRYFFGEVCRAAQAHMGFSYEIITAERLPSGAGGKSSLRKFHHFLRRRGCLFGDLEGKTTAALFFADKDIDDIERTQIRSPHFLYTEHYDVQNYVFLHGDIAGGAAAAASLDRASVEARVGAPDWCRRAADRWRDWVALCLLARRLALPRQANYGRHSMVNDPPHGPVNNAKLVSALADFERASGLQSADFAKRHRAVTRVVDVHYSQGIENRVFKGKWYAHLLSGDLRDIAAGQHYQSHNIEDRLVACIAATLDFRAVWVENLRRPLEALASRLPTP